MTNEQTFTARDVVAAIRLAYRAGRPGYYYVVAELGVEQLLRNLVTAGVVPAAAVLDPRMLPIQTLEELPSGRRVASGTIWHLSKRFATLGDVAALSFAELVAEPDVGAVAAQKIEAALASLSVLLRDGDPELLRRAPAPAVEEPAPAPDPEQARAACGRALLLLVKRMMQDGASLTAVAAQVELDPDNARKQLRMYSRNAKRTSAAVVARIAAPIIATGKAETKGHRGRRTGPAASENVTENVFPIVFGAGLGVRK